jgi:hypothetical protein
VGHCRHVTEIVERDDLDVLSTGLHGPPEVATDPTETVDTYANRHDASPLALSGGLSLRVTSATLPTMAL